MTKQTLTWRENNFGDQSGPTLYIFVVPGGGFSLTSLMDDPALNQIWHDGSRRRRNHLFQILTKSVKGFPGCEGAKMGVFH